MLTQEQLSNLTVEQLSEYNNLSTEDRGQWEYFYGFTFNSVEVTIPTNKEIDLYRNTTDTIKLKTVAQLLGFTPHDGQKPLFYTFDMMNEVINNYVMVLGRRSGKSASTSIIAVRELLVPFSATVLLTPVFSNAKIIFNEVLKHVQQLNLPIKSINKGSFYFELENGARFSANSESNCQSALGGHFSLIVVDESQSFTDLLHILNQMFIPTTLDYGTRASGILYARIVALGTPRGVNNVLHDLYTKELDFKNWKSFNSPSHCNPVLPTSYFQQMRLELGEILYRQEVLAEFIGADANVFWAFDKNVNLYERGSVQFSKNTAVIAGIDIGARDSTAQLLFYRMPDGTYYLDQCYSKNMTSTKEHIKAYREQESKMLNTPEMRYVDPAACQTIIDYTRDYDYECCSANNDVQESITYINQLLVPTGANEKPKLFICSDLTEVIRQISRVLWKAGSNKTSRDPFVPDKMGTHWDIIAALRYGLYTDRFNVMDSIVSTSSR